MHARGKLSALHRLSLVAVMPIWIFVSRKFDGFMRTGLPERSLRRRLQAFDLPLPNGFIEQHQMPRLRCLVAIRINNQSATSYCMRPTPGLVYPYKGVRPDVPSDLLDLGERGSLWTNPVAVDQAYGRLPSSITPPRTNDVLSRSIITVDEYSLVGM